VSSELSRQGIATLCTSTTESCKELSSQCQHCPVRIQDFEAQVVHQHCCTVCRGHHSASAFEALCCIAFSAVPTLYIMEYRHDSHDCSMSRQVVMPCRSVTACRMRPFTGRALTKLHLPPTVGSKHMAIVMPEPGRSLLLLSSS
jgi:hypothetical protein